MRHHFLFFGGTTRQCLACNVIQNKNSSGQWEYGTNNIPFPLELLGENFVRCDFIQQLNKLTGDQIEELEKVCMIIDEKLYDIAEIKLLKVKK